MAQHPHHSVSSLEIAVGTANRWRMDCLAVRLIFRQRLAEIGQARVQSQNAIALSPGIEEKSVSPDLSGSSKG